MADNKSNKRSTGRRSSILKRQDTCSEGSGSTEGATTPTFKRRVSFARQTSVRTFETLPWNLNQSDDSSSSVNHSGTDAASSEDEVFQSASALIKSTKNSQKEIASQSYASECHPVPQPDEDQERVFIMEQNKTIMYSELHDSENEMEMTTNVSQLSSSWFASVNTHHSNLNSSALEETHVGNARKMPWSLESENEVEKTKIFLSSDNDNMEITRNFNAFPSLSRFLKEEYRVNESFADQENLPRCVVMNQEMNEDTSVDMEMTGLIKMPLKRRSALVDMTENKILTPIEEMSASSLSVSGHENNLRSKKNLSLTQVFAKLQSLDSGENSENHPVIVNQSSTSDPVTNKSGPVPVVSEENSAQDPEITFNFHSRLSRSPGSTSRQSIEASQSKVDVRNLSMDITEDVRSSQAPLNCLNQNGMGENMELDQMEFDTEKRTTFSEKQNSFSLRNTTSQHTDARLTSCDKPKCGLLTIVDQQPEGSCDADRHEEMTLTDDKTMELTNSGIVEAYENEWLKGVPQSLTGHKQSDQNTVYMGDMEMTASVRGVQQNLYVHKRSNENTVYFEDMEMTKCVLPNMANFGSKTQIDDQKRRYEFGMEPEDSVTGDFTLAKSSQAGVTVEKTVLIGDMELTSNVNVTKSLYASKTFQANLSKSKSSEGNENTVFTQQMDLSCNDKLSKMSNVDGKKSIPGFRESTVFLDEMELTNARLDGDVRQQREVSVVLGKVDSGGYCEGTSHVLKKVDEPNCKPGEMQSFECQEKAAMSQFSFSLCESEEMHSKLLGAQNGLDESETLNNSMSLSEIAGLKSPKKHNSCLEKSQSGSGLLPRVDDVQENFDNSNVQRTEPDPAGRSVSGGAVRDLESAAPLNKSVDEITADHQTSKSNTVTSTSMDEGVQSCNNFSKADQALESSLEVKSSVSKDNTITNEGVETKSKTSDLDKKRAALRKSLCSEMMFPNRTERTLTKGLISNRTLEVVAGCQNEPDNITPSKSPSRPAGPVLTGSQRMECQESSSQLSERNSSVERPCKKSPGYRLSTDFFEDGDMLDGDCPPLEDDYDLNAFKNDGDFPSFSADELAFHIGSILEAPNDEAAEKDAHSEDVSPDLLKFSEICREMGIEFNPDQRKDTVSKPSFDDTLEGKVNASLFVIAEVASLEKYICQLTEECSRNRLMVEDRMKKFSSSPPETFAYIQKAKKQGSDVSAATLKVRDMAKACHSSARSKYKRHKADYLMHLTLAQQTEHEQKKNDLSRIRSEIDRIANVSAEIDKCMEDLNVYCISASEIQDLKTRTTNVESETSKLKSHCDSVDKQVDDFIRAAKDSKLKLKNNEEEQELVLDKINFMACMSEWSLLRDSNNFLTFGFLFNTIRLNVRLSDGKAPYQKIAGISFKSKLSDKCSPWAKLSHELMASSIDKVVMTNTYEDISQLLSHLSDLSHISRELCCELKNVHLKHRLTVDGQMINVRLFSYENHQKIEVKTTITPGLYSGQQLQWEAVSLLSPHLPTSVVNVLNQVRPGGSNYITRSLDAVLALMAR